MLKLCFSKYIFFPFSVVRKPYEIRVDNKEVFMGNVAFLKCFIPEHVRDYVKVVSWYRGDDILLPELADIGKLCAMQWSY